MPRSEAEIKRAIAHFKQALAYGETIEPPDNPKVLATAAVIEALEWAAGKDGMGAGFAEILNVFEEIGPPEWPN